MTGEQMRAYKKNKKPRKKRTARVPNFSDARDVYNQGCDKEGRGARMKVSSKLSYRKEGERNLRVCGSKIKEKRCSKGKAVCRTVGKKKRGQIEATMWAPRSRS